MLVPHQRERPRVMLRTVIKSLFGPAFGSDSIPLYVAAKVIFIQKVLRINGRVPWPVHWSTRVVAPQNIDRGSRTPGLSAGCHIDGRNGIVFGRNVWIGPRVTIVSMNHEMDDYRSYVKAGPISIGDNCWLGAGAIILPSVELGPHTIVAAGAVVTTSFPQGDLVLGGNPARPIKMLGPYKGTSA